jgi:hypothetical protein
MPGITAATPGNIIIGAGDITRDSQPGGATLDDNVFRVEQDRFVPALNGTKWDLMGTSYISKERAFLEFTSAETDEDIFPILVPEATGAGSGTLTSDDTRRIGTASHHDFELEVPGLDGLVVTLKVNNALQSENAEFTAGDSSVMAPRVVAQAFADPADLTTAPWEVVYTGGS